jgi:hypothetical protein
VNSVLRQSQLEKMRVPLSWRRLEVLLKHMALHEKIGIETVKVA